MHDKTLLAAVPQTRLGCGRGVLMFATVDLVPDPVDSPWWTGYMLGLRRSAVGEGCGAQAGHDLLIAAIGSPDVHRNAMANGYKAGLTRLFHSAGANA
jgi:hypothetical protein